MDTSHREQLAEWQQRLLMKYADDECRWWEKPVAIILLKGDGAQRYLGDLQRVRRGSSGLWSDDSELSESLWARVSARIDQEEQAALFLGERKLDVPATRRDGFFTGLTWGVSGAIATASIAFAAFGLFTSTTSDLETTRVASSSPILDANSEAAPQEIEFVDFERPSEPRMIGPRLARAGSVGDGVQARNAVFGGRSPFEVEWMRSQGRVSLIQAPESRTAILWVKRSPSTRRTKVIAGAIVKRSARPMAHPTMPLNEAEFSSQKRVPQALSVGAQ